MKNTCTPSFFVVTSTKINGTGVPRYMVLTISEPNIPQAPQVRRAWIRLELAKRGYTLVSLAKKRSCSYSSIRKAMVISHPAAEDVIAKTLGLKSRQLWPERFDDRGHRIKKKPGRKPRIQHMEQAA